METKVINITPEIAKEMLTHNAYNRTVAQRVVHMYAAMMRNNEWHTNGESISFDEEGNLINGQHRLLACIEANTPFACVVVTGVRKQDSYIFDKGRSRSIRASIQIAQKHGEMENNRIYSDNSLIAVARYLLAIKIGRAKELEPLWFGYTKYEHLITIDHIYSYMKSHKDGFEGLLVKSRKMKRNIRKAAILAALLQAYESGYPMDKLERICNTLATGIMGDSTEAIVIKYREKFSAATNSNTDTRKEQYMSMQKLLYNFQNGNYKGKIAPSKFEYYKGAYLE